MKDRYWKIVRGTDVVVGGILVTAALFKAAAPSETEMLPATSAFYDLLYYVHVQIELIFGVLLAAGTLGRAGRLVALVLFLGFMFFSTYRAFVGYDSCGCFGAMKIHPWITSAIDLLVICVLILGIVYSIPVAIAADIRRRIMTAGLSCALLGCVGGSLIFVLQPRQFARTSGPPPRGSAVILEPDKWNGQWLPIAQYFSPNFDLRGDWTILLYHQDCPNCQAALPFYERLAEQLQFMGKQRRVMLVEIPPYGPAKQHGAATAARLSDDVDWFVQAPVEIQLVDGIVTAASRDLPSIAAFRKHFDSITTTQHPANNIALE